MQHTTSMDSKQNPDNPTSFATAFTLDPATLEQALEEARQEDTKGAGVPECAAPVVVPSGGAPTQQVASTQCQWFTQCKRRRSFKDLADVVKHEATEHALRKDVHLSKTTRRAINKSELWKWYVLRATQLQVQPDPKGRAVICVGCLKPQRYMPQHNSRYPRCAEFTAEYEKGQACLLCRETFINQTECFTHCSNEHGGVGMWGCGTTPTPATQTATTKCKCPDCAYFGPKVKRHQEAHHKPKRPRPGWL